MDKFKEYIDGIWGRSYMWKQPWLEHDEGCAKYTINQRDDRLWHATWWNGYKGYEIGRTETLEEAKEVCAIHLHKMYEGIKEQLGKWTVSDKFLLAEINELKKRILRLESSIYSWKDIFIQIAKSISEGNL